MAERRQLTIKSIEMTGSLITWQVDVTGGPIRICWKVLLMSYWQTCMHLFLYRSRLQQNVWVVEHGSKPSHQRALTHYYGYCQLAGRSQCPPLHHDLPASVTYAKIGIKVKQRNFNIRLWRERIMTTLISGEQFGIFKQSNMAAVFQSWSHMRLSTYGDQSFSSRCCTDLETRTVFHSILHLLRHFLSSSLAWRHTSSNSVTLLHTITVVVPVKWHCHLWTR